MPEDRTALDTLSNDISTANVEEQLSTFSENPPPKQHVAVDAEWEELSMSLAPVLEGIKSGKIL
jgi:hypothetical protein